MTQEVRAENIPEALFNAAGIVGDKSMPGKETACLTCPLAVWFLKGSTVKAYCTKMSNEVWKLNEGGCVRFCSAKDEALKEKKEADEAVAEWQKAKAQAI